MSGAGRLTGLDLFDRAANPSPLAIALGASGSGKSVFVASIINSVLATLPEARVKAIDFGESFGPHVDALGGRHLRFNVNDPRAINTWDYEGLEKGEAPDEIQIAIVVMELMLLARVKPDDSVAEDILTTLATEVYRNEVPRNSQGGPKREPTLSNLLALLESYPFENQLVRDRAATLALALDKYRGHQWVEDQGQVPAHPRRHQARRQTGPQRKHRQSRDILKGVTMTRKKSLFYRLTLGLLIGALIMPAHPARAQWAVYDAPNHKTQIRKMIEDAQRHVKTFDNAVKQYTTLRGVLGKAEELVTNQLISKETMAEIGRTVRASSQLKDQIQAIVTTRLTMLKSIDDRLRRGIFDPEADMRDLEDYLRTSIGRSSQDSLATLERLQRMDNTLERMIYELKKVEAAKAGTELERKKLEFQLAIIDSKSVEKRDPTSKDSLMQQMRDCDALIVQYNAQIAELQGKIKEHTKKYHVLMDERIKFADQVDATNMGWRKFNDALDGAQRALSKY